ncbi:MAG: type I glutamate--ammonia ligase [candidate division WOR-3 bacterium]
MNTDEIVALGKEGRFNALDIKYTDLLGRLHHITIPREAVNQELFSNGIPFDAGSLPGMKSKHSGDMVLLPDPETAFFDPFWEKPTLSVIATIAEADTRKPFHRDARGILARAEELLRKEGIADESLWGPEYEFFIFKGAKSSIGRDHAVYEVDLGETYLATDEAYHAAGSSDRFSDIRQEIADVLIASGINVKYHHHEVAPCQEEIEVPLLSAIRAADASVWIKHVVHQTAKKHGLVATFMPKPLPRFYGNGMHFHQLLRKGGKNLFYEKGGYADLSRFALSYIAGLLIHGRTLCALTNPSTNSYRRLVPDQEAPTLMFFSLSNRLAAVRIPKYATSPDEKRIELRTPDATSNPYLAIAAQIMAGLDGIRKGLDPTALGLGPHDVPPSDIDPTLLERIPPCPESLEEALNALEADHAFLTEGGVFAEDTIETWIKLKRQEARELRRLPHPWEYGRYFEC